MKKRWTLGLVLLASILLFFPHFSRAEGVVAPFTVTAYPLGQEAQEKKIGEYQTLFDALGACEQEKPDQQFVVTMNKDYVVPPEEVVWDRHNVNILLRSAPGHQYTLKRTGDRLLFYVSKDGVFRTEHIILDGNKETECTASFENAKLTLGSGTVVQNFKDLAKTDGPAITLLGQSVLIVEDDVIIRNNESLEQGGVIQGMKPETTILIQGGLFSNNHSTSDGGAIAALGKLTVTGGRFEENEAKTGGALYCGSKSTAEIQNATFEKNKARTGGALYAVNEISVEQCTFLKNEGTWGGAICSVKTMLAKNTSFTNNQAGSAGGSLYLYQGGSMEACTFSENQAGSSGGAVYHKAGALQGKDVTFNRNQAGRKGGGLYIADKDAKQATAPTAKITGNTHFTENKTLFGGGAYVGRNSQLNLVGASFTKNEAAYGGGLTTAGDMDADPAFAKLSIQQSRFEQNQAILGAGIYTAFPTELEGTLFRANQCTVHPQDDQKNPRESGFGGGLYIANHPTQIKACSFEHNTAVASGGAIYLNGMQTDDQGNITGVNPLVKLDIQDHTTFKNNLVTLGQGGAIFVSPFEYAHKITNQDAYRKLTTDATTLFVGNQSAAGKWNPPSNYKDFTNLQFDPQSDVTHETLVRKSLLNNYDVNFKNDHWLISFDANGGSGQMDPVELSNNESYPLPKNAFTPPTGKTFAGWSIGGKTYQPGDTIQVNGDVVVLALWQAKAPVNPTVPDTDKEVIGGDDRIDTANDLSKHFNQKANSVIVVRKDLFPDALTASVLAKALDAPILLTDSDHLDSRTAAEITRLGASKAYIIGRELAVSRKVAEAVQAITGEVERIGGADRFETAALVAKKVVSLVGRTGKAVIVTGSDFADSLAISPYAASKAYPILLVQKDRVPEVISAVIKELGISQVYIAGGEAAVSKKVQSDLPFCLERIGGQDRYETAVKLARRFFPNAERAFLASGQSFADSLVTGPVAASYRAPILLTMRDRLPMIVKKHFEDTHYRKLIIVGLSQAIAPSVWEKIK